MRLTVCFLLLACSPDGKKDWPVVHEFYDVAEGPEGWVAVGSRSKRALSGAITATSVDGVDWTVHEQDGEWHHAVAWFQGAFYAGLSVEHGEYYLMRSTDGVVWERLRGVSTMPRQLVATESALVLAHRGYPAGGVQVTTDGSTWVTPDWVHDEVGTTRVTHGDRLVVLTDEVFATSVDGLVWETAEKSGIPDRADPTEVVALSTGYIGQATYSDVSGSGETWMLTSADGLDWDSERAAAVRHDWAAFDDTLYGVSGDSVWRTEDLEEWERVFDMPGNWLLGLHARGDWLFSVGDGIARSADGVTWEVVFASELED